MATATTEQAQAVRYHALSPTPGVPLRRGAPDSNWFGSGPADGYVQALLEAFEKAHPEAAKDLAYIANEAKWSSGWKGFGRLILEIVG